MVDESAELRQILSECLDVAKQLGTELDYELTEAVEMESESTNASVRFVEDRDSEASLNVRLLLEQLEERTVVAAVDLYPPPQVRLVISGGLNTRSYRILIHL